MDEMYWKQYEADLIKGYMLSVMQHKGTAEWELEFALRNAQGWAKRAVKQIKESFKED